MKTLFLTVDSNGLVLFDPEWEDEAGWHTLDVSPGDDATTVRGFRFIEERAVKRFGHDSAFQLLHDGGANAPCPSNRAPIPPVVTHRGESLSASMPDPCT